MSGTSSGSRPIRGPTSEPTSSCSASLPTRPVVGPSNAVGMPEKAYRLPPPLLPSLVILPGFGSCWEPGGFGSPSQFGPRLSLNCGS